MTRPADLPDFERPPLNEVFLGIQFANPPGYQQIHAGEVWALFRDRYPVVLELPAIAPQFETFGQPMGVNVNFGVIAGAQHDRFWFVSKDGVELIQFQNDRLLHNWRKVESAQSVYPRFEHIIKQFEQEATTLESYCQRLGANFGSPRLAINQCEICYVNHIGCDDERIAERINPELWLQFGRFGTTPPDDFSANFRRPIRDVEGRPIGRLICECQTSARPDGREMIVLTITARAMPLEPTLQSALEFLCRGREMIVRLFAEITTDSAHKAWGRVT